MTATLILSPEKLDDLLSRGAAERARRERSRQTYDLLSFGGGSCPKVVGRHAARLGWNRMCFLTNGSDNGGSTQKIVEALRPDYGPTLPVGDITSALIALLDPFRYELLNLRGWKPNPDRFTTEEQAAFSHAIEGLTSFHDRLASAVKLHRNKFAIGRAAEDTSTAGPDPERFCRNLLQCGRMVDEAGLVRPGVNGLDIAGASVRHHVFNAVMIRAGAYDSTRRTPDPDLFTAGLALLQRAFSIEHDVFPCSIDEQALYAEWVDESGKVVWSTKRVSADRPATGLGGQVALSNAPDSGKTLGRGKYARFGRFGFDPGLPAPRAYAEALDAIRRVRPGAPILFGPSSFVASISPCLAVPAVANEIRKRSDCPRILFLNLTLNNETVGWTPLDFLDFWELNTGGPAADTLDYVVANNDLDSAPEVYESLRDKGDTPETFKFRGPVCATAAERTGIPGRGITLVEAPLASVSRQLMRLSSTGEREFAWVPSHHPERLMNLCSLLARDFQYGSRGSCPHKRVLDDEGRTAAVIHPA